MASLQRIKGIKGDNWRINYYDSAGARKFIRLGKCAKRAAESVLVRVRELVELQASGLGLTADLRTWSQSIGAKLHAKLSGAGLLKERGETSLKAFLDGYIASRTDIKASSVQTLKQGAAQLIDHFGPEKPLRDVTVGDATIFRRWLRQHQSENTARRNVGRARQFFSEAVDLELIDRNPFAKEKNIAVRANRKRECFVEQSDVRKVIEAATDDEFRLIIALARWGGLRMPSEVLNLTWDCVDWQRGTLLVKSPKNERHEDGGERLVPLFHEVRTWLERVYETAERFDKRRPETAFIVRRYRDPETNLRTRLLKTIRRAGLKPWPKLFQNMRLSRSTELSRTVPQHVAAKILGHSVKVAAEFYWQVDQNDLERAKAIDSAPLFTNSQGGTISGTIGVKISQKQLAPRVAPNAPPKVMNGDENPVKNGVSVQSRSVSCVTVQNDTIGQAGFEPATKGL
jgi:integrase